MSKLYTTITLAILTLTGSTQCNLTIPMSPGHIQVSSDQSLALTGTIYWVCENVNLTVTASPGSTILLEQNAIVTFDGSDGDQVYAKSGCVVTNNTPEDIGVAHDPTTTTLNNNGSGSITTTNICTPVVYDYQFVGGSPCVGPNSIAERSHDEQIMIYPNPISGDRTLRFSQPPSTVEIYDITGALVKRASNPPQSVGLEEIHSGHYIVRMIFDEQIAVRSLIVE